MQEHVGADALLELNLMYVLTRLPEFARSLFRWVPVVARLSAVPRSKPAPWEDHSVVPPSVLDASVVSSALLYQASQEAIVNKTSTVKALAQIVSLSSVSGSVRVEIVRSVTMGDIRDLVQHGLVTADEDEFGALVLTVVRNKIEPNVMQHIGDPIHAIRNLNIPNLLKCSKIEVLGRLREQGWQHAESICDGYEAGSPRVFRFILE